MSTPITLTDLERLDPDAREQWRTETRAEVTSLCLNLVAVGEHPGVVGKTTPAAARAVLDELRGVGAALSAPAWTTARIRRWQDRSVAEIRAALLGADGGFTTERAAAVALGLCDLGVRDVAVLDLARGSGAQRAEAGHRLWPIAEALPDYLRAPTGTVLALLEWTAGRPVAELLDWATETTEDYRLAGLVRQMAASGLSPSSWMQSVSSLDEAQCLNRTTARTAAPEPSDPLTQPDQPAADVNTERAAR